MFENKFLIAAMLLLSILILSCGVQLPKETPHHIIDRKSDVEEGILFTEIEFNREQEAYSVKINSLRLMGGTLKKGKEEHGDIACILLGENLPNDTVFLENPLHPHYEEYETDGSIKTVEIELDEAFAFVRSYYKAGYTEMRVVDLNNKKIKYRCSIQ